MQEKGIKEDEGPFYKQYRCIFGWIAQTTYVYVLIGFFDDLASKHNNAHGTYAIKVVRKSASRRSWLTSCPNKASASRSRKLAQCSRYAKSLSQSAGMYLIRHHDMMTFPVTPYLLKESIIDRSLFPILADSWALSYYTG